MAQRTGKCTNYSSCMLAYRNETITVTGDFVCPECKQPLQETAADKKSPQLPVKWLAIGGGTLAALLVVGIAVSQCGRSTAPALAAPPSPTPEPTAAPVVSPPPVLTPAPVASSPAQDEPPVQTPAPQLTPPADQSVDLTPPDRRSTDPANPENKAVKDAVLVRIEAKQDLSQEEKDRLHVLVDRAKGFGQVITISFQLGKAALSPSDIELLKRAIQDPYVKSLVEDPTAVFVILGFSDKLGDPQSKLRISQNRADSVAKALKEKCDVSNLIYTAPMGATDIFSEKSLERNRVVEVWVALP